MTKLFTPATYTLSPEELPLMKRALRKACRLEPSEGIAAIRLAGRDLIETTPDGLITLTEQGRAALAHHKAQHRATESLERPRLAALAGAAAVRRHMPTPPPPATKTPKVDALKAQCEPSLREMMTITTYDRRVTARLTKATLGREVSPQARRHWGQEREDG